MKIHPVTHTNLAQVVAGRLAAYVLDGELNSGDKLPAERKLMQQLSVSRATLREALTILAENRLIDVKPGVGSFVRPLDRSNYVQATELALAHRSRETPPKETPKAKVTIDATKSERGAESPAPIRVSVSTDKTLRILCLLYTSPSPRDRS